VNTLIGLLIGLVFGLIVAFVWESLDTSIGTIEDVESYLDHSVLGVIPHIDLQETKEYLKNVYPDQDDETYNIYSNLISHFLPKSTASESFRALRTNLQFLQKDKGVKTLVFTSASAGEGKTTTLINLAITLGQLGRKVLIVDGDLRNHAIHYYFGIDREPGFTDAILGNVRWKDAAKNITDIILGKLGVEGLMATPGLDNISVLTVGTSLANPSELLDSYTVKDIIEEMKQSYDYVLIDTPPVLPVADALILSGKVDAVIIVYKVGQVARSVLKRAVLVFDNVYAKVLGVVLNGLRAEVSPDFHHTSYYYYSNAKGNEIPKSRKISGDKAKRPEAPL
jgi:capsular exopolysaccharide synthesis family protein